MSLDVIELNIHDNILCFSFKTFRWKISCRYINQNPIDKKLLNESMSTRKCVQRIKEISVVKPLCCLRFIYSKQR